MHGSIASVGAAIEACLAAGARLAEPGEFTLRAFANGRIDLTQAEAIRDTINAKTEVQLRVANRQREGAVQATIAELRRSLEKTLAELEATIDFSEEIGEFDRDGALTTMVGVEAALQRSLATANLGRWIRDGVRIAIVGTPNAGKSSLLNRLVGSDRAIVTAIPGTTRDTIEAEVVIEGVPVQLVDTAGIRDSSDVVEVEGIQRTLGAIEGADIVLHLIDATNGIEIDFETAPGQATMRVANKIDLMAGIDLEVEERISAMTGEGIDRLIARLGARFRIYESDTPIAPRHALHVRKTLSIVQELVGNLAHDGSNDILSVLLNEALRELGKITGQTADGDMINRIFHDFCVGK